MYIVIKAKTNNIFKVKIFWLLPLSIHNRDSQHTDS